MKLHQAQSEGRNLFTGYGDGYLLINRQRHDGNLIVTPSNIIRWEAPHFDGLVPEHFNRLKEFSAEMVILGTGKSLRFPHPRLTAELVTAQIGIEVMDTAAACRTYNILLTEDRRVVAVLFVEAA